MRADVGGVHVHHRDLARLVQLGLLLPQQLAGEQGWQGNTGGQGEVKCSVTSFLGQNDNIWFISPWGGITVLRDLRLPKQTAGWISAAPCFLPDLSGGILLRGRRSWMGAGEGKDTDTSCVWSE